MIFFAGSFGAFFICVFWVLWGFFVGVFCFVRVVLLLGFFVFSVVFLSMECCNLNRGGGFFAFIIMFHFIQLHCFTRI